MNGPSFLTKQEIQGGFNADQEVMSSQNVTRAASFELAK